MAEGMGVVIDARELEAYLAAAPRRAAAAAQSFLRRGSLLLEGRIRREATQRFGVETAESGMQGPDASRPKGIWAASVHSRPGGSQEVLVGGRTPYDWWVEMGSRAPRGVPASHQGSVFRGHGAVRHGVEGARGDLANLWGSTVESLARGGPAA